MIVAAHAARIERTAEQLVHRHPQRFAANIPQRLVDRRDRRPHHRTRAIKAVHIHRLPDVLHLHRVRADQEIAEVVDTRHHGAGFAFERAFAPSDQPLVGLEFDEHVRPIGVRSQRNAEHLHPRDLQARIADGRSRPSRLAARLWREGAAAATIRSAASLSCAALAANARPAQPRARKFLRRMVFLQCRFIHVNSETRGLVVSSRNRLAAFRAAGERSRRASRDPAASGTGTCWMKKFGTLAAR